MAKIGKDVKVFFRGVDISNCVLSAEFPIEISREDIVYAPKEHKEDYITRLSRMTYPDKPKNKSLT